MNILDTDMVSLFHSGHQRLAERIERSQRTDIVVTTIITEAEIIRGRYEFLIKAKDGDELQRAQYWLESSKSLLADLPILSIDAASATRFDELRKQRRLKKIGRADLLIASIAVANGATLVTRNLRHFRQVQGLNVENWAN